MISEPNTGKRDAPGWVGKPHGRFVLDGTWKNEFHLRASTSLSTGLGNTRAVLLEEEGDEYKTLQQKTDYYPFGMVMNQTNPGTGPENKLLYNGKEIQDDVIAARKLDWYDYGARFYDPQIGRWHSVDPLAEKRIWLSPYNYVQNNPILRIDPDGALDTEFKDKDGNTISHVNDGSNAVFQLNGTDHTNEYFEFVGYSDQGGENETSVEGAITGAQDYVTNNYTKCNQAVNFVGRTYESAVKAQGQTVDNINIVNGNSLARDITTNLASNLAAETSVANAQASASNGNLVVGANGGHVVTMTTRTFDITRYDATGRVIETKQIGGGRIANVNGSTRPTNIGPGRINSFQNPTGQPSLIWYSFPRK